MNRKFKLTIITFLLLMIGTTSMFVPTGRALELKQGTINFVDVGDSENVAVVSPEEYIPMDKDWTIVKREFRRFIDPTTGLITEHETIWREAPMDFSQPFKEAQNCSKFLSQSEGQPGPNVTCYNNGNVSRYDSERRYKVYPSNYIEARLSSYATKYCPAAGCTMDRYYDMYQYDASWVRTHTNWTARDATGSWGCPVSDCYECNGWSGGWLSRLLDDNVNWVDNTRSMVYIVSYSGWPEWQNVWETGHPVTKVTSKGYYDGVYQSPIITARIDWTN